MTTTITMLQTRLGEGGVTWTAGNSYAASDDFAAKMISGNYATGTLPRQSGSTGIVRMSADGQSLVDADGNVVISLTRTSTWSQRATLAAAGVTSAFFTDVGIGGSHWFYAGARWRPVGGRVTLKNLTVDVSNSAAPKVVMDYATLLAGVWQDGDRIRVRITKERTGGTSDTDATDVLLGTVAATLGTTLNLTTSALATTATQLAVEWEWRRISSTSVRTQLVPGATGFGTSTSPSSLITGLANLDSTDTYLQVSSDLTTAGGEVVWLRGYVVDLICGA